MTVHDARIALDAVCEAGASHLKVEFEAEGASSAEANLLASLAEQAGLRLVVKIGGCEAIRDIRESLQLGAQSIVAPMIESPFAVQKFVRAVTNEADAVGMQIPKLAINIESVTGIAALTEILAESSTKAIDRLVLGRTDLSDSLGLSPDSVNDALIENLARQAFGISRRRGIATTLGGTLTLRSVPFVYSLEGLVDSVETRKVVYPVATTSDLSSAIRAAVQFEISWLDLKARSVAPLSPAEARRLEALGERLATRK